MAHPDTLVHALKRTDTNELGMIPYLMARDLLYSKCMAEAFLFNCLMIAVDATCTYSSHESHCDECLVTNHKDGSVTYSHYVLEAKIVRRDGLVVSVASEPISNPKDRAYDKQDCELKAFYRLAPRLKEHFKRSKIVLLMDSLYACAPVFKICNTNSWDFIIGFKRGSIPTLFDEAMTLLKMEPENVILEQEKDVSKTWRWLGNLQYFAGKQVFDLGFIDYREKKGEENNLYFSWLTSFKPDRKNVKKNTEGGRLRWQIEEGFNEQKNGYDLVNLCRCSDPNAMYGLYLLLQIAHILMQLLAVSNIIEGFGTLAFLADLLIESLRNQPLPDYLFAPELPRFQIRSAPT